MNDAHAHCHRHRRQSQHPHALQRPRKCLRSPPRLHILQVVCVLWSCVWVGATTVNVATATSCTAAPLKTLTWNCTGRCLSVEMPCLVYSAAELSPCDFTDVSLRSSCPAPPVANTTATNKLTTNKTSNANSTNAYTSGCDVQCFELYPAPDGIFRFNVAFTSTNTSSTRPTKPPTNRPPSVTQQAPAELTNSISYETNEFVRRIGVLQLPSSIKHVVISGGRSGDVSTRGSLVQLEIDAQAFSKVPNVTSVGLLNMDLGSNSKQKNIAAVLPRHLQSLDLRNTNLTVVPDSLRQLTKLQSLALDKNWIVDLPPARLRLPKLTDLRLQENELVSFPATTGLPLLQFLDLSDNKLEQFPYQALVDFPKLQTLRVDKNPTLQGVVFTSDQFAVISKLTSFAVDASALDTVSCSANQLQQLPPPMGHAVCVVSVDEWTNLQQNPMSRIQYSEGVVPANGTSSSGTNNDNDTDNNNNSDTDNNNRNDNTNSVSSTVVGVLVGVFVGIVVATAAGVGFVWCTKHRHQHGRRGDDRKELETTDSVTEVGSSQSPDPMDPLDQFEVDTDDQHSPVAMKPAISQRSKHVATLGDTGLDLQSIRVATSDFRDVRVMGAGSSAGAIVWLVEYRKSKLLVSKRLIAGANQSQNSQAHDARRAAFLSEIQIASTLSYPTIVAFVGVAWTCESDLQALFEYMAGGDLRTLLNKTTPTPSPTPESSRLSWHEDHKLKLRIAVDVIKALVYTHSFNPPLLHRNLKAQSVLLTDGRDESTSRCYQAKLSDFSSARHESENETMTTATCPTAGGRWLAPEILSGSSSYDASSDIYAFGVLLSELDTHALPYADVGDVEGNPMAEVALLQRVAAAHGELRPSFSETCPVEIRALAAKCMSHDRADRPTAMQVEFALRPLLHKDRDACT